MAQRTTTPIRPFSHFQSKAWPHRFRVTLELATIAGGTPTDPHVAEGWLRSKLGDSGDNIREAVATTMVERGVAVEEATELVNANRHLNGFKRDETGLLIEGRQLKASIKESVNVAVAAGQDRRPGVGQDEQGFGRVRRGAHRCAGRTCCTWSATTSRCWSRTR